MCAKGFRWIISWIPSIPLYRWGSWGAEVSSDMARTGLWQSLRLKHTLAGLQPPWATMVYWVGHSIQGREIPSPGSPEAEQPCPCHWAPRAYSPVCKEEESCARYTINSDVLLTRNLFIYVAGGFQIPVLRASLETQKARCLSALPPLPALHTGRHLWKTWAPVAEQL